MKLPAFAAAVVLSTLGAGPVHAAGQPQLGSQDAATNGNTSDQSEKNRMETKSEQDTQKYQGQNKTGQGPAAANKN